MVFTKIVNFKQKIYSRLVLAILCSASAQWLFSSILTSLVNFRSLTVPQNVYLLFCNSFDYRIRFFSLLMTAVAGVFIGKDLINLCYEQTKTSRFHSTLKCFSLNTLIITTLELIFVYVHFAEYQTMFVPADYPFVSQHFQSDAKLFLYFVFVLAFYLTYTKAYHLPFTVIKENRLRRLRTGIQQLFRKSLRSSLILAASYLLTFNAFHFEISAFGDLNVSLSAISDFLSKFFLLFAFSVSYLICRRLVDQIFEVFLTQHMVFSIISVPPASNTSTASTGQFVSMSDAMKERFLSLVQQLACYDFFLMSHFDEERRLILFRLQEMNSRHLNNWKTIVEDCTDIINKYARALNKIFEQFTSNLNANKHVKSGTDSNPVRCSTSLRNMSMKPSSNLDMMGPLPATPTVSVTSLTNDSGILSSASALESSLRSKVMQLFLQNTWYKFLFHERLTLKLHYLLENNKPIIWLIDGLVELMKSSLKNDKYGVAAEDFIAIIRTLKLLEQQIDRFNKLAFMRKFSAADINFKNEIQLTLRRNYFKINSSIAIFDKKYFVPLS